MAHKFQGTKGVLIDLPGTVCDRFDDRLIEGASEAVDVLNNSCLKVRYMDNTARENRVTASRRLEKLGLYVESGDIFNSLTAARYYVEKQKGRPYLLMPDDAKFDFCGMDMSDPNYVIVGLPPADLHYCDLNYAFQLLMSGADLIAANKLKTLKKRIAAGGIVAALEYAADLESLHVGKPSKNYFQAAAGSMRVCPKNLVLIGDDYREEIIPAIDAGMKAILVRTGKYMSGDERRIGRPSELFHTVNTLLDAVDLLLS